MPRFTPIYGAFVSRLDEVQLLCRKASKLNSGVHAVRNGPEISALCRGSVVLLSSHIEAYIKELGEHTLDSIYNNRVCRSKLSAPFFYHISKEKLENIRIGSNPEKIATQTRSFLQTDSEMWKTTGHFPNPISAQLFNSGFSNPKFEKIKAYLGRFGYTEFRHDIYHKLGRDANVLISNIDQIVDSRNSIAHGDPNATKTPLELLEMIKTSKSFCRTVDELFATWCALSICKIR